MKMMQGDSYPVFIDLKQDGVTLTPDMIDDLEVCVGENLRKTYSGGGVAFDTGTQMWYIRPTQQETLDLPEDSYTVIVRVKYKNQPADVKGISVGRITIRDTHSEEVL